jgi:type I restriction enzyme S subunit
MSDLPPGWVHVYVDDIKANSPNALAIGPFGSNLKVSDYREAGVPLVFVRNIRARAFATGDLKFVSSAKAESLRSHHVRQDDLLVTKMGDPPGDAAIYPLAEKGIVTADCIKLTPHPSVNVRYLLHALATPAVERQIIKITQGVAQPKMSLARFRHGVRLSLAPSAEQDRIVAAIEEQFSRLDAGVAALERVRQNLNRMRSAAFALIADSVDAWVTLGEIAEVVGGVTKDSKRQSDPSFVEVPYLRVANVQRGYLDLAAITTIRVPTTTAEKLRLEPRDILFNEGGDRDKLGRGWIWEGEVKDCIHQNHVFRARLLTDKFDPRFVSMHGNTFGRTWFEKMGKQTTNLASLNLTTLKSFPVPNLPIERQHEIVAEVERRLSLIDSLQSATDDSLARCNSLRSSILAAAFSGVLVPQDSTDEPASTLLERIAAERAPSNNRGPATTRKPRTPQEKVVV